MPDALHQGLYLEADPLPVAVEREAASFSTDDVPLDLGVLRKLADSVAAAKNTLDVAA